LKQHLFIDTFGKKKHPSLHSMINTLSPKPWAEYQLIDSGHYEKLERFGPYILRRPEPQAIWDSSLALSDWEQQCHAYFKKDKGSPDKGQWILNSQVPNHWYISYPIGKQSIKLKISLSAFKHVGLFPEQAVNWDYIAQHCQPSHKVLNLFAYTGAASLAAKLSGADVTHVDSIKQVITWARDNMTASQLDNIRWLADDALKFAQREQRRGNLYQGIILDPPAYGRGPDGEKWVLEEQLNLLLKTCQQILDPKQSFLILNVYSLGFSALIIENLVKSVFGNQPNFELGELYIPDSFGKKLPLGVFCRFGT
jgi:23S rRNA (cytosine1962-C5)-methyltransferase